MPIVSPPNPKDVSDEEVLQTWNTRKLNDQRDNLSNKYVDGLRPVDSSAIRKMINLMYIEFKNASSEMRKSVEGITIEKLTEEGAFVLRDRVKKQRCYSPFPNRKSFVYYCKEQCRLVNKGFNIRIYPSGWNPWMFYVIMVPSTSYLYGTPIVGIMTLPSGFPRSAPTFTHFASVGTRFNVNYYIDYLFRLDQSTSCNSLCVDWKKNNLCHECKDCLEGSVSCNVCNSEECKALAAKHKEWDYYCTWDTILQSFLLLYISVYIPHIRYMPGQNVPARDYSFQAETPQTIKKTIMNQWAVYFQLIELFERHHNHFPPGEEVVYGKIIDTHPLEITCIEGKMVSVPSVSIPPEVLAMGWEPKGHNGIGKITYTSKPMSLGKTGYSVILLPGENLFTEDFELSFILSTEKPPVLHPIGQGVQRTLRWDTCGNKMEKKPHGKSVWENHGPLLRQVFAIWLTFANDQFVVAVQETKESLPHVLSGVPVGRLSSVFRPYDKFYLNVLMKTTAPVKRFTLDILPITKGVVCNWNVPPVPTGQAMYAALVVRNSYALIKAAKKYFDIQHCWENYSYDLEERHPEFQDGFGKYSLVRNTHSTLGHTNDQQYRHLIEYWKVYGFNTPSTDLVVDAIHFDKNAVAFSVQSIEPPIKSLHDDFQHIVIGLTESAGGPNYVSTHLLKSDTYNIIVLKKPLIINTRMMIITCKV
jgi:hypothetical protein